MGKMLMGGRLERGRPVGSQVLDAWELAIAKAVHEGDEARARALVDVYDGEVSRGKEGANAS
jgi:hypothetical protein